MANWPCRTEDAIKARDALAKMGKYCPHLLPAFDITEKPAKLIEPPEYEAKLCGALAKVVVMILCWSFEDTCSLCANIVEINILRKPVQLLAQGMPKKKRIR